MASEVLMTITKEEREAAWALSREKYLDDMHCERVYARRAGERKGRKETKFDIARKLKKMGDSVEKIAAATGLPREAVEKL